jgi:hypothetical protein
MAKGSRRGDTGRVARHAATAGRKVTKAAREMMQEPAKTDEELLADERERKHSSAQRNEQAKIVKALEREVSDLKERHGFLDGLINRPAAEPFKLRAPESVGRKQDAAYVMLASDWHVGERVRPENIGGRNEYNPEIAQERARQYFCSQLRMLGAARAAWDIRTGVLWLGGDLITGYIHEEYLEENFLSPSEEAILAYDIFTAGIKTLLAQSDFETLLIPTSNGNHGRTGAKMKVASSYRNSFEWMLYSLLAKRFEDEPRVKFQIGTGYHNLVDLYGFRINFHHGDAVGYGGGVGGLSIPINRRIGRSASSIPIAWEGTQKDAPHLNVLGHFHQLSFPGPFIVNGSLIGWNDFADRIACAYQEPLQASFVVDSRYKLVSAFNPILVEKRRTR